MAKLTLSDPNSLANETSFLALIAANNTLIETALENTLSRDGTSPNAMGADLDMNSKRILNLPAPVSANEPARKADLDALPAGGAASSATAAAASAAAAALSASAANTAKLAAEAAAAASQASTVADGAITTVKVVDAAITNAKLANMVTQRLKGRNTGSTGAPEDITISQVLDWISSTRGTILFRGSSSWSALSPGTAGQLLQTGGAGADPSWTTPASAVPSGSVFQWASTRVPSGYLECDGSAVSRSTYSTLFAALVFSGTATITIASPAVVTWNTHGLKANDVVRFTTTGALPTGLATGTDYYVLSTSLTSNTFRLAASPGGAAINTTGTQSGTHTVIHAPHGVGDGSTTFNLPDLRGEFVRGWDNGRGVDSNRTFGSAQTEMVGPHTHTLVSRTNTNTTGSGIENVPNSTSAGTFTTNANSGTENRPRNKALMYIIKT